MIRPRLRRPRALRFPCAVLPLIGMILAACDGWGPGGPDARDRPRWTVDVGHRTLVRPVRADAERAYVSGPGGVGAFEASTGELLWLTGGTGSLVGRDYAVAAGVVAIVELDGSEMTGLDARDGSLLWRRSGVPTVALIGDGGAFYASDDETTLVAYDAPTGADRWRIEIADGGFVELYAGGNLVCVERLTSSPFFAEVQCFDRSDGAHRWTREVAYPRPRVAIAGDRVVVTAGEAPESGEWMGLDAETGETVWRAPGLAVPGLTGRDPTQGLAVSPDGTRVFGCGNGCLALRVSDGTELWRRVEPEEANAPVVSDHAVWVTDIPGLGLWSLDAATGSVLRRGRESDDVSARGFCGTPAVGGGNLYVFGCGPGGILLAYEIR